MADVAPGPVLDPGSRRWALVGAGACLLPLLLQLSASLAVLVGATAAGVVMATWRKPLHGLVRVGLASALIVAVIMLSGANFGRDTGCALLAAMLAIKPAETFTLRDARSLIGFALFAPFGTFLLDQGPVALGLGLFGALLALVALQRLADLESGDAVATGAGRRFLGIARLVAIGLPLALAIFWLFPRLATPLWGVPDRATARPGLSDSMSPGEWVDLMNDDTPALRVRFRGPAPAPDQMYWRGPVLWHFDGRSWTQSQWMRNLPPAVTTHAADRWDYEVQIEPTDRQQLVALDLPVAAPDGARLALDHGLHVREPLSTLTRWRMQSAAPRTYEADLRVTLRQMALALPDGYNPRTLALARQWRAMEGDDDQAIVDRAMDWIRAEFIYTLETPLLGRHAVDEFLFDQKRGFCEHYSSAFVVLMRAAGIPSRVVTGYAGGYRNPVGEYWLVRRSDAHAWAEVWLEDRGWVRVDPTAAVAPERVYDTLADRGNNSDGLIDGVFGGRSGLFDVGDFLRSGWNELMLGFDAERQARMLQPLGIDELDGQRLALLFSLCAALGLLWMVWLSSRGEREPDPVLRAWHALNQRYGRLGLAREPHEPSTAWAERVSRARPDRNHSLLDLTRNFTHWRYAREQPGRTLDAKGLARALRAHRPATDGDLR